MLKNGRLHALPSPAALGLPWTWRGIASYDLLSWPARLRLALEPLVPRRRAADEPVAAFFRRRFGSETVGLIAEPLLGGIHAGDIETLSLRSLFPKFAEAESKPGGVLRSFRRAHRPGGSDGLFRSLSSGMGELVSAIERRLPERAIRYRTPATSLTRDGGEWRVRGGDEFEARAAAVVLAAPAHAAARLLQPVDAAAAALPRVPRVDGQRRAAWPRGLRHPLAGSGFIVARRHNAPSPRAWVSSKWQGARRPA